MKELKQYTTEKEARDFYTRNPQFTAQKYTKTGPWMAGRVVFGCLSVYGQGETLLTATNEMLKAIQSGRKF